MRIPKLLIEMDGAEPLEVQCKPRDFAAAERDGVDFTETGVVTGMFTAGFYALRRLAVAGEVPFTVPDTLDAFLLAADVSDIDDEDPEGKAAGLAPSTG